MDPGFSAAASGRPPDYAAEGSRRLRSSPVSVPYVMEDRASLRITPAKYSLNG
jgi:hypothetical protein